ncbi:3-oxoacyl-reductase [Fomitopsis serialis]|uniref:3-oxoacyl-reductase n=1 Tax=Fomitopsis serialis TaxID=139415 RepID=UPI0020089864|nr:3-oxoacyl-reductase [Neoantrodia serialis]KAH9930890.1 3-oxoacyl-reductase [Neoantrodia serialis]
MAGVGASLRGRLVLITGCTGGIGQATAKAFARVGCSIAVHYNAQSSAAKAETLIAELKTLAPSDAQPKFAAFQANLSGYDDARRLYGEVVQTLGNPDVLFSNHGMAGPTIGPNGDIRDISPEVFEETWRTNTGTHFLLTQLCVPYMEEQKWGRVIYTSSVAAGNGGVIGPHYASSKSALHGLVRWMSLRYAKSGITTNALAPALIEGRQTNMMSNPTPEARSKIPIGRLGKPNEMADIVLLLASNGYMTNKARRLIIVADGGWTIGNF